MECSGVNISWFCVITYHLAKRSVASELARFIIFCLTNFLQIIILPQGKTWRKKNEKVPVYLHFNRLGYAQLLRAGVQ